MRRRLVASIAGVAATAVVLLAIPLGLVLSRSYRDQELLRLQRDTVAATRGIDVRASDRVELPRSRDALTVYDRRGRRLAGRGPGRAPAFVRSTLSTGRVADGSGGGRLVVAVPLLTRERLTGVVLAQRSDAVASRDARSSWLVLAAVSLGIVSAAALAAVLLARRLAGPLERLAGRARRLGEGDFSVRTERTGIAEVDEAGAALDATAARLHELVSRERAFSADASHQLRTPLQALRIELEAIELRGDPPSEVAAALAQVERLQSTIDTLLGLARGGPRAATVTDLRRVIDEAEASWRGRLAAEGRPLRVNGRADRVRARVSPAVVAEILEVLLANARHHGAGAVSISLREVEGWLALEVADEGPGFHDPEHAFDRGVARGDGHGIGLALARSLAHAEGGRLTVADPGPSPVMRLLLAVAE